MPAYDSEGESVHIPVPSHGVDLEGTLARPTRDSPVVIFAHGSGSSRHSPRNRQVARALRERGLGTLLFDLLSPEEEVIDLRTRELRFDITLLALRVVRAVDWVRETASTAEAPIGLFGASTGAAAALIAAVRRPSAVGAVVSRGGRPDLAGDLLGLVRTPTLFIVGGADSVVIELNREASALMPTPATIEIVPGATHLFEEPGALERVSALAGEFFARELAARPQPSP